MTKIIAYLRASTNNPDMNNQKLVLESQEILNITAGTGIMEVIHNLNLCNP